MSQARPAFEKASLQRILPYAGIKVVLTNPRKPRDIISRRALFVNRHQYRKRGTQLDLEAAIRANPSAVPSIAPDAIRIPFSVSVTPGIRYRVKEIRLDPGLVVTQADFDRQSHIHPGDPADGEHIRANWLYLERQYHNHGFIRAKINATPTLDRDNGTVTYVATVHPGPAYSMGTLNIENVSDELRTMMLTAWKMPPGAVFNEGSILGFFATIGVNPKLERVFATVDIKYVMRPDDATRTIDLTLRLERKH